MKLMSAISPYCSLGYNSLFSSALCYVILVSLVLDEHKFIKINYLYYISFSLCILVLKSVLSGLGSG